MLQVVYTSHGFNVRDGGKGTTDLLHPFLKQAGYIPVDLDYGWAGSLSVRLCNVKLAMTIAKMAQPGSIALGHSNGCTIIHEATLLGAPFDQVVYINPALNNNLIPGPQVRKFHVWYTHHDWVVKVAAWIPFSDWGNMGAVGHQGADPRAVNHNMGVDPVPVKGHSDVFTPEKLIYWAPKIIEALI